MSVRAPSSSVPQRRIVLRPEMRSRLSGFRTGALPTSTAAGPQALARKRKAAAALLFSFSPAERAAHPQGHRDYPLFLLRLVHGIFFVFFAVFVFAVSVVAVRPRHLRSSRSLRVVRLRCTHSSVPAGARNAASRSRQYSSRASGERCRPTAGYSSGGVFQSAKKSRGVAVPVGGVPVAYDRFVSWRFFLKHVICIRRFSPTGGSL